MNLSDKEKCLYLLTVFTFQFSLYMSKLEIMLDFLIMWYVVPESSFPDLKYRNLKSFMIVLFQEVSCDVFANVNNAKSTEKNSG